MDYDVVVAGAGPVGLMLAAELQLAGVSVVVLERSTEQSQAIRAGGINGRSTQALARRGLRARLEKESAEHGEGFAAFSRRRGEAAGDDDQGRYDGHFAGLFLHARPDFDIPPSTVVPQQALERLLDAWVTELGVPIRRGHAVTWFEQDEDGVTVRVSMPADAVTFRCRYLVGCDGGRSTVRKLAGFDFPGTDPLTTGYQAIVTFEDPDVLPMGWHLTDVGLCAQGPTLGRLNIVSFDGPPADREAPITIDELQQVIHRISGLDVTITSIAASTRYTDNARQATTYRKDRVLLAGDAAHVHPPFGGQGLNLGLQDAVNLGWKLAATVAGTAPAGLLDTYTAERHPVAARVLENTRAQTGIMRPDPHSRAMRDVLSELIKDASTNERLVGMLQGLDIRYDMGSASHPLTGCHVPDLPGIEEAMHSARPVLFDHTGSPALRAVAEPWADRVDLCELPRSTSPVGLLVRPDGYVAWATTDGEPDAASLDELTQALKRWF